LNVKTLFDERGNLKPITELTLEQAASIASVEVVKKNLAAGDGQMDTVLKIRLWDKPRALEMLAKHFALLTDVVKVEADAGALVARLQSARKRAVGSG
jgi:phage terminase small subunit